MFSLAHIHPMVVHFPIAIILLALLVEFLSIIIKEKSEFFKEASYYLMILACISAIVTLLTGFFFTEVMIGEDGILREQHERAAIITTIFITVATILRIIFRTNGKEAQLSWIYQILLLIGSLGVIYTGNLGGNLVY